MLSFARYAVNQFNRITKAEYSENRKMEELHMQSLCCFSFDDGR